MRFVQSLSGLLLLGLLGMSGAASASCFVLPFFPDVTLDDWQVRKFEGNTRYSVVYMNGGPVLEAHTDGAASILYRKQAIDIVARPHLSWSWRVDSVFEDIDEMTREGDDFPARVYVVAKTGMSPWSTLALNYVWASETPVGTDWRSPYTDKAQMIVVRSGMADTGEWVCQKRDVAADFHAAFGVDIDKIAGYAVMVDGDNTGSEGRAWFGDIAFTP